MQRAVSTFYHLSEQNWERSKKFPWVHRKSNPLTKSSPIKNLSLKLRWRARWVRGLEMHFERDDWFETVRSQQGFRKLLKFDTRAKSVALWFHGILFSRDCFKRYCFREIKKHIQFYGQHRRGIKPSRSVDLKNENYTCDSFFPSDTEWERGNGTRLPGRKHQIDLSRFLFRVYV